ncbi:hypothetical protein BpHYR1_019232 [Brachionus plicatilis]|uniref:Uncharacterized protein n=1 Tax=Brachionus plicatilis TaxID=10195 RepID=A0A3M7Q8P3_BRAPC|nr:hypothetical protein BpHYR1_019232 [Brachionus plicatilis]
MNGQVNPKLKKSEKAKNLEQFFISNHRISIDRNKKLLEELSDLQKDLRDPDKNSNLNINFKQSKNNYWRMVGESYANWRYKNYTYILK